MKINYQGEEGYFYKYEHAAFTTDSVVFGFDGKELSVLLIQRKSDTYDGCWAFPGGFLNMSEDADECARRELAEETNAVDISLSQFRMFSAPGRDPRERVVTMVYIGLVRKGDYDKVLRADTDAQDVAWFPLDEAMAMSLAFDHNLILVEAYAELRRRLRYTDLAFHLLDEKFTINDLRNVCEVINNEEYDVRNSIRKSPAQGS